MINWLPKKKLNYSWANNKWLHRRSSEVAMKEMTKRIFWFNEKVLLIAKAKRWHFQHLYLFVPYLADVKSMWLRNYTHTHTHTHKLFTSRSSKTKVKKGDSMAQSLHSSPLLRCPTHSTNSVPPHESHNSGHHQIYMQAIVEAEHALSIGAKWQWKTRGKPVSLFGGRQLGDNAGSAKTAKR